MTPIKTWLPKIAIIALGVGVGIGLVAIAVFAYLSMPKGWDRKAITATFESAEFSQSPSPAAYYTYTLTNNTSRDYSTKLEVGDHLPSVLRLASRRGPIYDKSTSKNSKSFAPSLSFGGVEIFLPRLEGVDEFMKHQAEGETLFIPAGQNVRVRLRWELEQDELAAHTSVNIVNTSLYGFVLYDDASRFEIDFPKPPLLKGSFTKADIDTQQEAGNRIAPDHTDKPWEQYQACGEAAHLAPLCIKAGFKRKEPGDWIQYPLPEMVLPPKGYFLEPDADSCEVVFEWKTYCNQAK